MLVYGTMRRLHIALRITIMLKLDITKAFDIVEWAFLIGILQKLGFNRKWVAWLTSILASSSTRLLANRILGEVIYNKNGLRQGDSLPLFYSLW